MKSFLLSTLIAFSTLSFANTPVTQHQFIPQDLNTVSKTAKKGDILIFDGNSTWYKLEEVKPEVAQPEVSVAQPVVQEKSAKEVAQAPQVTVPVEEKNTTQQTTPSRKKAVVKVLPPQKDLDSTIRSAKKGDVIIYDGSSKWYKIEGQNLKSGTRVYVLGDAEAEQGQ